MKRNLLLLGLCISISLSLFAEFPQDKVTELILGHHQKKSISNNNHKNSLSESKTNKSRNVKNHIYSKEYDFIRSGDRETLYVGPGADTTFIYDDYQQDGNIIVCGDGVLLVDNATLTLYGHLYQQDNGKVILQNGAYLHVPQLFNCQYLHALNDSSKFEAINSTVDGNVVYQIRQYDNSEYTSLQTNYTNWNFRKLWNNSKLTMVDANMVGDLTINDSVEVEFTRCDTILPWLGADDGDVFDYQFPDWEIVPDYVFDDNLNGIDGIDYSVSFEDCVSVLWGVESWSESSVTINSSLVCIVFRIDEDVTINNIEDYTNYDYLSFPFEDRTAQINYCQLYMWFPYVYYDAVVYVDNCRYAESKAHDQSEIYFSNTISDGFPSNASPVDDGFIYFEDGLCRTYSSSWYNATLLMVNTRFEPRPNFNSSQNIAHGYSTFLASNCTFLPELEPYARDAALVMFAAIDSLPNYEIGDNIEITGSAWIDAGSYNSTTFDHYELHYASAENRDWIQIGESTNQIFSDTLFEWNTSDLEEGNYDLMLTIFNSIGDSLIALRTVTLLENNENEEDIFSLKMELLGNYPNPFNPFTTISFSISCKDAKDVVIEIFNIKGQHIREVKIQNLKFKINSIIWDGTDESNNPVSSGIYLYKLKNGRYSATQKMILLR